MKKFVKGFLIALCVLTICMTSVSVSAAALKEATYADGVVTVKTQGTGEVTILATRQNGSGTSKDVSTAATWENIVYLDQAAGGSTFNFVPERASASIAGDTVTVFLGTEGGSTVQKQDVSLVAVDRTLSLIIDGAPMEGADTEYTAEAYTLPQPTKDGYTFNGWYENAALTGTKVTEILAGSTGAKTFYAEWKLNASVTSDAGYYAPEEGTLTEGDVNVGGVISVTASFKEHVTNITKCGFYVYRDGMEAANWIPISADLNDVHDFYTIVYGIPAEHFNTGEIIIVPYVEGKVNGEAKVVYGETKAYTVNGAADKDGLKYLGTLENVASQVK